MRIMKSFLFFGRARFRVPSFLVHCLAGCCVSCIKFRGFCDATEAICRAQQVLRGWIGVGALQLTQYCVPVELGVAIVRRGKSRQGTAD